MINNKIQAYFKLQKFEQDLEIGKLEKNLMKFYKIMLEEMRNLKSQNQGT